MAQDFSRPFYHSAEWKRCQANYVKAAGGLCERCLSKGIIKAGEIVHHRTPLTPDNIMDPAITLSFDNLMLVCRDCHAAEHKPGKRYKVDDMGRVIAL